jgi:hypothetical protein
MRDSDDQDQLSNRYFAEAFPDADSPAQLLQQVYKYTDCGAYLNMTIEYLEVSGTGIDDYYEKMVRKTIVVDDLDELGTWKAMDERGQLAVSFTLGSIVEGVDYGTDEIEIESKQLEETSSEYRKRFDAALTEVEDQAESIWQENGPQGETA